MSMKPHKKLKNNKTKRNIKKTALINYELKKRGLSQAYIAKKLNISRTAVNRAIGDLSKITKVNEWLEENLRLVV